MQKQILSELKELRTALSKVLGTSNLPQDQQFSIASLGKAASEFKKMQIARCEWVTDMTARNIALSKKKPFFTATNHLSEYNPFRKRGQRHIKYPIKKTTVF